MDSQVVIAEIGVAVEYHLGVMRRTYSRSIWNREANKIRLLNLIYRHVES